MIPHPRKLTFFLPESFLIDESIKKVEVDPNYIRTFVFESALVLARWGCEQCETNEHVVGFKAYALGLLGKSIFDLPFYALQLDLPFDIATFEALNKFWSDQEVQRAFENRSATLHLVDNVSWFFNTNGCLERIFKDDYEPSDDDLLHCYSMTTGIVEDSRIFDGSKVQIVDFAGSRVERRKWKQLYQGVTCVIYVVPLSSFNEILREDNSQQSLDEALELFTEVCDFVKSRTISLVIYFNMEDLFKEKLRTRPVRGYRFFETYLGGEPCACSTDAEFEAAYSNVLEFVINRFLGCNKDSLRKVAHFLVSAVDLPSIQKAFVETKALSLQNTVSVSGFME